MTTENGFVAFGVEPGHRAPYVLRQSRYHALAATIAHEARSRRPENRALELLDVGVNDGLTLRYLEPRLNEEDIVLHGVDLFPRGEHRVYQSHRWHLHRLDLEQGMPNLAAESFDVVVCE